VENILDLSLEELQKAFQELGLPPFRAKQIYSWAHHKLTFDFEKMSELPKLLRSQLSERFNLRIPSIKKISVSKDGTKKYLVELNDGNLIESVLLEDGSGRKTICLSTQVGCSLDCTFCATGSMGFKRNLKVAEILGQVYLIAKENPEVSNLVFMGMGEPFLNYDKVLKSIRILTSKEGPNFGQRKITVSTCGIPDTIRAFAREGLQVRLAISLNAADDPTRSQLMPINRKYGLAKLLDSIKYYIKETGRRVTLEYVMLDGINDREQDIKNLIRLCRGLSVNVNLIPFNPFGKKFKPSSPAAVNRFLKALVSEKINAIVRRSRGTEIHAACGQLAAHQ